MMIGEEANVRNGSAPDTLLKMQVETVQESMQRERKREIDIQTGKAPRITNQSIP